MIGEICNDDWWPSRHDSGTSICHGLYRTCLHPTPNFVNQISGEVPVEATFEVPVTADYDTTPRSYI